MQITNIVRDVGEDWARGRLYLPGALLQSHGLAEGDIGRLAEGSGPLPSAYVDVVEAMIARADAYYEHAWPGIRALPGFFRRPVAAAASAYRGIHREVRRNGYDNLRRRAHTSMRAKLALVVGGLLRAGF
jgi:phytoene synthase